MRIYYVDVSWQTYHAPNSGNYNFVAPTRRVDQQDYTHVRVFCSGTVEVTKIYAVSMGFSVADLLDFGYATKVIIILDNI